MISRVYLIDDDPISILISQAIIRKNIPVELQEFTNPVEALRYFRKLDKTNAAKFPDVIFLDINMPEMNGWEFLEEFENLPDPTIGNYKVIMLTSSIDQVDIQKSRIYRSVCAFISKPLTGEKLISALKRAS